MLMHTLLVVPGLLFAQAEIQAPLIHTAKDLSTEKVDIIYELEKAEIIPTVIDKFKPLVKIAVTWKNASAHYGNTIHPDLMQDSPSVIGQVLDAHGLGGEDRGTHPHLAIALTDPDAPSRENPEWSEICHWLVSATPHKDSDDLMKTDIKELMPYKPPGPPPKTWKHRYVFVLLAAANGTEEELNLTTPGDRQHWGYKHERNGLRLWAEENEMQVVGANFIYSKDDEQEE